MEIVDRKKILANTKRRPRGQETAFPRHAPNSALHTLRFARKRVDTKHHDLGELADKFLALDTESRATTSGERAEYGITLSAPLSPKSHRQGIPLVAWSVA